jgi:hypothetical protein
VYEPRTTVAAMGPVVLVTSVPLASSTRTSASAGLVRTEMSDFISTSLTAIATPGADSPGAGSVGASARSARILISTSARSGALGSASR